jgi:hypothetical protein
MDNECLVVQNSLSRFGLRVVHLINADPIGDLIFAYVPAAADGFLKTHHWKDKIGLYHAVVAWRVREAVRVMKSLDDPEPVHGVMWWISDKKYAELEKAKKAFLDAFLKEPNYCLTQQSDWIHDSQPLADILGRIGEVDAFWMPEGFIFLCDEVPEREIDPSHCNV